MSEKMGGTYSFAELENMERAIEDIRSLERKLSDAYGEPVTLIAFVKEGQEE